MRAFRTIPLLLLWVLQCAIDTQAQQPFAMDPTFQANFDTWYVSSLLPVDNGKVVISGQISYPGAPSGAYKGLARLNANGSWDATFNSSSLGIGKITPWADRFYVASTQTVRRILLSGMNDVSFIGMNTGPYFLSLQGGDYHVYPDGRILMSGAHELQDSIRGFEGLYNLIWFSNTGYLDTTRTHRTSNGVIYEIEELPGGRFICSGTCTQYEGQPTRNFFRVQPDGTLDPSFQSALAFGDMDAFTPLGDGRILASGLAMSYQGATDTTQFVRFMADGSLDSTFNNDIVVESAQFHRFINLLHTRLPDGRILLNGGFDHVEGEWRSGIALLDANGELLSTAFTGLGCGAYDYMGASYHSTRRAVLLADSMMYIFGAYHGYDDGTTNDPDQRFVTRLYGPDYGMGMITETSHERMQLYPNPTSGHVTLQLEQVPRGAMAIVRDALGREVLRRRVNDHYTTLAIEHSGVYLLELHDANGRIASERVVVE